MGLNIKAPELDHVPEIESRLKAPVCSTPSGVASLANTLSTGFTRGYSC
jgi:hypothetical protein